MDVTMTTYKRADGEPIGDYGRVTDLEYLDSDANEAFEPVEYVEETWLRTSERRFTLPICRECDEPATHWGLCEKHAREDDPSYFTVEP